MGFISKIDPRWIPLQIATFLLCAAINRCACTSILPDLVHCSSSVVMLGSSPKALTSYHVDEYIDLKGERSSLSVVDLKRAETKIYYNQVQLEGYAERKFLMYSPMSQTCKPQSVLDWPLNELRKVSIHMYSLDTLRRDYVDVPMGPSVILYAVLENAQEFKFITTIWSKSRLSNVDVYGRPMYSMPVDGWRKMNMIVHVPSKTNRDYQLSVGDPLTNYLDRTQREAKLVMIGGCLASDLDSSTLETTPAANSRAFSNVEKLDEDTFCDPAHLRFVIRYNIVTEYQPGTLVGKGLVDLGSEYSFHREPFVQPSGIGCWGSATELPGLAPKWQRTIGKSMADSQLSGEYVTTRGSRGISFVAYDRVRHLLRLDQGGRKSVYDLLEQRSYHVGEFSANFETTQTKRNELLDQCVALEMDKEIGPAGMATPLTSPMLRDATGSNANLLKRLIGLSDEQDGREHYLGTRIVDHVAYEVFEREWNLEEARGELPILLRATKFNSSLAIEDRKLYLTYYVRLDHQQRPDDNKLDATNPSSPPPMMIVKYIEMYEFDVRLKRKSIVNRLRFIEFSWSLDAVPTNDYDGAQSSHSPTLHLFNLEPCQRARSQQAELVVEFKQSKGEHLEPSQVEIMRSFELEICERLVSLFASTIELSRLNIVDLKLQILPTGDMISTNKFVDLRQGLSELSELGKLEVRPRGDAAPLPAWRASVARVRYNRYSLEDCLLDGLAWPEPNRVAYCPLMHECLIMRLDSIDELKKWFVSDDVTTPGQEMTSKNRVKQPILCTVYSHRYSTVDEAKFSTGKAADVAELKAWLLNRKTLELNFNIESGTIKYVATLVVRHVRRLDPIGARLANSQATLAGLRHTTREETGPESINVNQRVSVASLPAGDTAFRHCQLACQMDDLCASFSVCERGQDAPGDCVLSSLRLNAERTAKLIELGAHENPKHQFQVKITSACESQVFVMQRDDTCALHARDFLADYRVTQLHIGGSGQASGKDLRDTKKGADCELDTEQQVSLDECAGLCSELNLFEDPKQMEFTYCPLESRCFVKSDKTARRVSSSQLRGHGQCYVYAKRLSQAYEMKRMHHMSIKMKMQASDASEGTEASAKQQVVSPTTQASPLKPPTNDDQENEVAKQVVTRMWGLSEEKCARECNLHKSTCLSFDTCRQSGKVLCLLYAIRSPLSKQSAYLPSLNLEQLVQDKADVSLVSTLICDHYHLKAGYFEVRLKQLRDREQQGATSSVGKIDEIENFISNSDREHSKQDLETLQNEYKSLEQQKRIRIEKLIDMAQASWLHVAFLAVGLLIGCLGALYKDYLVTHSSAQMRNLPWFRRQAPSTQDDLSELVHNDQMI